MMANQITDDLLSLKVVVGANAPGLAHDREQHIEEVDTVVWSIEVSC